MKIGRPRKFKSNKALKMAIEEYFDKISYTKIATDEDGKELIADSGKPIMMRQFVRPPTVTGLCLHLGIDRSTWQNYCDTEKHPEFAEVTMMAAGIMESYLEEELLIRAKPQGIIFNLQNNYGWREKNEVKVDGESSIEINVRELSEDGNGN